MAPSQGSFSLSHKILDAFMCEFESELASKVGKLDTDPHLWMPLTLRSSDYCELMASKGVPTETSEAHHARMAAFMERFAPGGALPDGAGLFGAVDIGSDAFWWDYGQLRWYLKNNLELTDLEGVNALAMRRFFGVDSGVSADSSVGYAPIHRVQPNQNKTNKKSLLISRAVPVAAKPPWMSIRAYRHPNSPPVILPRQCSAM